MNEIMKNITGRRSIRKFKPENLKKEDIETIVEAALCAPSAMNRQSYRFTVIKDSTVIEKFASAIGEVLGREGYNFYKPACLILASDSDENPYGKEDCACALQNMFLSAHSLGIGSVWINQFNGICDDERIRCLLDSVDIPYDHKVWGAAALGYSDEEKGKRVNKGTVRYI